MDVREKIIKITRQLFPTGRAWNMVNETFIHGLIRSLANSEKVTYNDAVNILYSLIPDNANFSEDDATDWERRLGMVTNLSTPLADRKTAILRKMSQPGTQPAKGHYKYIERQLQAANFPVYVYENIVPVYPTGYGGTYNPVTINSNIGSEVQHGVFQHGDVQHNLYINHVIANSIYNDEDIKFQVGNTLRSTFFIGGYPFGTYANVTASREDEFRQLVLSLKQVQSIAYLFINYV